jgi:hypothetical protein
MMIGEMMVESLIEPIEKLTEAINQINHFDLSAWIMIAITFVYVIATIVICIANLRSAKATREQVAEQKRQFDETNRPVIDVTIDSHQGAFIGFVFKNTGHKLARDINVTMNNDFIDSLGNYKERIISVTKSSFVLGIGLAYFASFGALGDQINMDTAVIRVTYRDDKRDYTDDFTFDLQKYNWWIVDTSDLAQIRRYIKKIAEKN